MVPEAATRFRSERLFASGLSDAFNRETERRKARGEMLEAHHVAQAVCLGDVERGCIHRRMSKGKRSAIHIPRKYVGDLALSGRLILACF